MRCFTVLVASIAVIIGLVRYFGIRNDFAKGMMPLLVTEVKITEESIPNLAGKTIIVTGANAGLGKSAAKHFAVNGARTILACRSLEKCSTAKEEIIAEVSSTGLEKGNLVPMKLDLGSLKSVKAFAEDFIKKFNSLDSLVLNAGIMHPPFALTEDGIESTIGVNHFGHFLLTKLLMPLLDKADHPTIVSVSSNGHWMTYEGGIKLSLAKLNNEANYDPIKAYGQSKLANVLFAQELAEKLKTKGSRILVNSMNPGGVNTELAREYPPILVKMFKWLLGSFPNRIFFESDYAALTEVYLAVGEEIIEKQISGKYFVPIGEMVAPSADASNRDLQKKFWNFTEDVLKAKGF